MKQFLLLNLFIFIFLVDFSGQVNWNSKKITDGSTLKRMVIFDDNTAVIAGLNFALKQTTDGNTSWHDVNLPDTISKLPDVDYYDLQRTGDTLLLCYKTVKLDDSGLHGTYANSNILISTDKGSNWSLFDYSGISDNSNVPANDAFADSCFGLSVVTMGIDSGKNVFINASWDEKNGKDEITHSYFYKSEDFGSSWLKAIDENMGSAFINTICFYDQTGFIGGNGIIYVLNDAQEWQDLSADLITANNDGKSTFFVNRVIPALNDHYFIVTSVDGIFDYDYNAKTMTKLPSFGGANDLFYLGAENILTVGSASKTILSRDFGTTFEAASPGSTLFDTGGIMNDSIYAVGKDFVYSASIEELNLNDGLHGVYYTNHVTMRQTGYRMYQMHSADAGMYQVYALSGKLVFNASFNSGTTSINLIGLEKGIYILRAVNANNEVSVHKLLIQ